MSSKDERFMIKVVDMYYKDEMSQDAISKKLNISSATVSRTLSRAKKEGIVFPVNLDLITIETDDRLVKQANSFKQSVEENTDGQIIVHVVLAPEDVVYGVTYYNEDPSAADYDISTFTGWGPDYSDPKSFAETMSPTVGTLMTSLGLGTVDIEGNVQDLEIKKNLGLMEYEELYQAAQKETSDFDKRYDLFAKADVNSLFGEDIGTIIK